MERRSRRQRKLLTPFSSLLEGSDRIEIQLNLGGKNVHTWEESAWRLADLIERRFGTPAARREARAARAAWGAADTPGSGA